MRLTAAHLDHARQVADAVLYEGYLLYPYRKSSQKNQSRFQFGVLMPPGYAAVDPTEASLSQTECLLDVADDAEVRVLVRFLQLQRRLVRGISPETGELHDVGTLYVEGTEHTAFDEAAEREQALTVTVADLLSGDRATEFHIGPGSVSEDITDSRGRVHGCVVREWYGLDGTIRLQAERVAGPFRALKLHLVVENTTLVRSQLRHREDGLLHALIAAHSLIGVPGGRFLSMTDPPEWAAAEVAACQNTGTWPVLAGPAGCEDLMLSSPVILYDHPEVAAESAGDLFDATEIDEILTLRTMALTDAEKRQARATDPKAAELIDRLDALPAEMLDRLHGAIRYLRSAPAGADLSGPLSGSLADGPAPGPPGRGAPAAQQVPWWDPGADTSVSPQTDQIVIEGVLVGRNSRVVMKPGSRRADAQDLFLTGREAVVEAVLFDVDGQVHLAVTPVDDPAADLQRSHGRFLYFAPDEVRPVTAQAEGGKR